MDILFKELRQTEVVRWGHEDGDYLSRIDVMVESSKEEKVPVVNDRLKDG